MADIARAGVGARARGGHAALGGHDVTHGMRPRRPRAAQPSPTWSVRTTLRNRPRGITTPLHSATEYVTQIRNLRNCHTCQLPFKQHFGPRFSQNLCTQHGR